MFSEPPATVFKGIRPDVPVFVRFQDSLHTLAQQSPVDSRLLDASLREWERLADFLADNPNYSPRERYCILQSQLWEIYSTTTHRQMEDAVERMIYNRACKVLERTPPPDRPRDMVFRNGDNLIRKMLDHLRAIDDFYRTILSPAPRQRGAQMIPPSSGFHCTNVLEANANPAQAEGLLQIFLGDNQYVRTILLGEDAGNGATVVDNRLNIPGGGVKPGRGLWVKSYTLLRTKISPWLAASLPHDYDQVRCIFISPQGKPASFLTRSVPLDQANVSDAILAAADADDPD